MSINYGVLREIVNEMPEVKRLLIERRQIEQDGKAKGSYTIPEPHLTPSNDKYHPKKHTLDKSKDLTVKKITRDKLKENAKKIEKAIYANFDKDKEREQINAYKQFKPDELVVFIEKGREQVLKDREKRETKQIRHKKKEPVKTTENSKEEKTFDRLQQAFDKIRWDFKEEQMQENKKDIQQDRGFSR
ncbi:MAG: hypothetical protein V3U92_05120 [Cellulophaga sp.]